MEPVHLLLAQRLMYPYLEAVFCRFPCIVHLKHVNNSHEIYFRTFTAGFCLVFEKAISHGEEWRNLLFVITKGLIG